MRADVVVVAAGAVETARLLASGIGNDELGRHLHDHRFVTTLSMVDEPVKHHTSVEVEDGMAAMGEQWLLAAGGRAIHRQRGTATASAAGEHSCGTARMGVDPTRSATDPFGRPWGTRRIVVCDSSLHPTNGSVNPTLTIIANAYRVAEHLVADWPH